MKILHLLYKLFEYVCHQNYFETKIPKDDCSVCNIVLLPYNLSVNYFSPNLLLMAHNILRNVKSILNQ